MLGRQSWICFDVLKRKFCPTLTKYYWVVQFISHEHPSSLKASFEIELDLLDFNTMVWVFRGAIKFGLFGGIYDAGVCLYIYIYISFWPNSE